jgi:hypothetical protein
MVALACRVGGELGERGAISRERSTRDKPLDLSTRSYRLGSWVLRMIRPWLGWFRHGGRLIRSDKEEDKP